MPALKQTSYTATIRWLGYVPDRAQGLRAQPLAQMALDLGGYAPEAHAGQTRPACSRVKALYRGGATIRNTRQLTLVSTDEMALIAADMGLERIAPEWLGASAVIDGIPDFSNIPPSSRLCAQGGPSLVADMQNRPCSWPAKEIEREAPGKGHLFKKAARGRRGITAWVEHAGDLTIGAALTLFVPDQHPWQP